MRKLFVVAALFILVVLGPQAAQACGGLVAPNGAVRLDRTTTLAAYHHGVEHYLTAFQYEGGGSSFGSIIPLPGVPSSVTKGGSWTLQRLEREVAAPVAAAGGTLTASAAQASVILQTQVDALNITVLKGGGPAVVAWVKAHGFAVSPDAPAVLSFYARRSPIFLAATFDPARAQARHQLVGDGTPIQVAIPTSNPWVPLRILALGKDPDDVVSADVFLLTDRRPALLTGTGVTLERSESASVSLLSDLRSDHNMSWVPQSSWLSFLQVDTPAGRLHYDLAVDASGLNRPSVVAAATTGAAAISGPLTPGRESAPAWILVGAVAMVGVVGVNIGTHARKRASGQRRRGAD